MKFCHSIAILSFVFLITSCSVSDRVLETTTARMSKEPSEIAIYTQINLNQDDLEARLDSLLGETVADGMIEQYAVRYEVNKIGKPGIRLEGRYIDMEIPLHLSVDGDISIARVRAEGSLKVHLQSLLSIQSDWSLETQTVVSSHEWIDKPQFKVGFIKISSERLADIVIRRTKKTLEAEIDRMISTSIDLPKEVRSIQDRVINELRHKYQGIWLNVIPTSLEISDLETELNTLSLQLDLKGSLLLKETEILTSEVDTLQYIRKEALSEKDQGHVQISLQEMDLERMMRTYLENDPFQISDGKEIRLREAQLQIDRDQFRMACIAEGYLKGPLYIEAEPVYDQKRNEIQLRSFKLSSQIDGFFKRLGLSFMKSRIQSEVEKSMNMTMYEWLEVYNGMVVDWTEEAKGQSDLMWNTDGVQLQMSDIKAQEGVVTIQMTTQSKLQLRLK